MSYGLMEVMISYYMILVKITMVALLTMGAQPGSSCIGVLKMKLDMQFKERQKRIEAYFHFKRKTSNDDSIVTEDLDNEITAIQNELKVLEDGRKQHEDNKSEYKNETNKKALAGKRQYLIFRVTEKENRIDALAFECSMFSNKYDGLKYVMSLLERSIIDKRKMKRYRETLINRDEIIEANGVIDEMQSMAETYLGKKVTHDVVTVSAYFNDSQRQATKDAGTISGLNVEYVVWTKNMVVATDGGTHLGGEYFVKLYEEKVGKDTRRDNRAIQKLRREVEKAKRALSSSHSARIEIESFLDGDDLSETLTRAPFEELNIDLFKNTMKPMEKVLDESELNFFTSGPINIPNLFAGVCREQVSDLNFVFPYRCPWVFKLINKIKGTEWFLLCFFVFLFIVAYKLFKWVFMVFRFIRIGEICEYLLWFFIGLRKHVKRVFVKILNGDLYVWQEREKILGIRRIYIRSIDGRTFSCTAIMESDVRCLKIAVSRSTGIPIRGINLAFCGYNLENDNSLRALGVVEGSVLQLIGGLLGGSKGKNKRKSENSKETVNEGSNSEGITETNMSTSIRKARDIPIQCFSGEGWKPFWIQFRIAADFNGWSKKEQLARLQCALKGKAAEWFSVCSTTELTSIEAFVVAIERRFDQPYHGVAMVKEELRHRIQGKSENLSELAEDIEKKSRLVYGAKGLTETVIQKFACDHFLEAIADRDLQFQVKLRRPKNLQEALEVAHQIFYIMASNASSSHYRRMEVDGCKLSVHREEAKLLRDRLERVDYVASILNQVSGGVRSQQDALLTCTDSGVISPMVEEQVTLLEIVMPRTFNQSYMVVPTNCDMHGPIQHHSPSFLVSETCLNDRIKSGEELIPLETLLSLEVLPIVVCCYMLGSDLILTKEHEVSWVEVIERYVDKLYGVVIREVKSVVGECHIVEKDELCVFKMKTPAQSDKALFITAGNRVSWDLPRPIRNWNVCSRDNG